MTGVKRPPGRPRFDDWRKRGAFQRLDTHNWSEQFCWLPLPDVEPPNPKAQVRWYDRQLQDFRTMSFRRYLWTQVNDQEDLVRPISWSDIIMAAASCESPLCLNPWHQVRMTRNELAEMQRENMLDRSASLYAAQAERQGERLDEAFQMRVRQCFPAYVAGRCVLLGTGRQELADECEQRADKSTAMADELRERLLEKFPKWKDAFAATPSGYDTRDKMHKRRDIVLHFWRTYPEAKVWCDQHNACDYLQDYTWAALG